MNLKGDEMILDILMIGEKLDKLLDMPDNTPIKVSHNGDIFDLIFMDRRVKGNTSIAGITISCKSIEVDKNWIWGLNILNSHYADLHIEKTKIRVAVQIISQKVTPIESICYETYKESCNSNTNEQLAFCIFHEVGHAELKHKDVERDEYKIHQEELDADVYAVELFKKANSKDYLNPLLFFGYASLYEMNFFISEEGLNKTRRHPSSKERFDKVKDILIKSNKVTLEQVAVIKDKVIAMQKVLLSEFKEDEKYADRIEEIKKHIWVKSE